MTAETAGDLDGQVAIVTGAGGGIGGGIVSAFAARGATVVLADLKSDDLALVVGDIEGNGGRALAVVVDVTDPTSVQNLIDATVAAYARVDIVVNNAGIFRLGSIVDTTVESWRQVFAVNLDGAFAVSRAALTVMLGQEPHAVTGVRGRIINVSSGAADIGRPFLPAYGASKAALNHLSKSLAVAYADQLVSTTVLYPGNVREGMWRDLGPDLAALEGRPVDVVVGERQFQTPADVAHAAVFIATTNGMRLNGQLVVSELPVRPI